MWEKTPSPLILNVRASTHDRPGLGRGEGRNFRFLLVSGINSLDTTLTELPAAALCLSVRPFAEPITDYNSGQHEPQVY